MGVPTIYSSLRIDYFVCKSYGSAQTTSVECSSARNGEAFREVSKHFYRSAIAVIDIIKLFN